MHWILHYSWFSRLLLNLQPIMTQIWNELKVKFKESRIVYFKSTMMHNIKAIVMYCAYQNKRQNSSLCSKTGFLKTAWHKIKMLPHLGHLGSHLPLISALKQGTAWSCTSRGIRNMTGQSWNVCFYLNLTCCISDAPWGIGSCNT